MKNQIFAILQRLGKSFMLPIAILPIAGLLLAIGTTFTNEAMVSSFHLESLLGHQTILNALFIIMKNVGGAIFANLPLIFAIGVALGMAKKEKGVAVLSAVIAFIVMHTTIHSMLVIDGQILNDNIIATHVVSGTITSVCGIYSLEMGVFGGIIVGLGVSYLHNRFYKMELPSTLSFFGGTRFVPIISTLVFLVVGIAMFYIWPVVQNGILSLGPLVADSGYFGTLLYGIIKRLLIPFGLHHIFYLPFWQTGLGGSMLVNGTMVYGGQNIFFAQLADPHIVHFSSEATRYFTGEFIFMIFGLPGAALAMYHCAKPENKKTVGGLLLSAALTSILTGITEPIEFSFLFVAPILFGVQVILAGSAYMIAHIFNIAVGLTFSGGFIDLLMFGILQGNSKTSWVLLIPIGIVYFFLYYISFKYFIIHYDLKTLGRSDEQPLKQNHIKPIFEENKEDQQYRLIVKGLGGRQNFNDLDCCVTRLRAHIIVPEKINESLLKQSGAAGVLLRGDSIQIIYGPHASVIKSKLEDYLERTTDDDFVDEISPVSIESVELKNIVDGEVVDISESCDNIFAQKMMGDGLMIKPQHGLICSPCDAVVTMIFPTKHAIGLRLNNGCEILLHFGVNTVSLNGEGFELLVKQDQTIGLGEPIWNADLHYIRDHALSENIMLVVTKLPNGLKLEKNYGIMSTQETILHITK